MLDLTVIGAGPCGLAVGVAAQRASLTCTLYDKGAVVASLLRYPLYMSFFSTAEKLEIGVPFVTAGDKPTRREALAYYRKVSEHFELDVRQYHTVRRVVRRAGSFEVQAEHPGMSGPEAVESRHVVFATGYFESPDRLGVPFVTAGDKPTRREALTYYRKVAEHFELDVRQYHTVSRATPTGDGFELVAQHPGGPEPETVSSRHLVFATGYFESPNPLRVPGEDLPHVSHFFVEPHPYWQQRVVVVGGGNSAVEAALELCRVGARVTLVHFLSEFDRGVKPWILPDITNRVKQGQVAVR